MKWSFDKQVDNSPLIVFRILFGCLNAFHAIKAIVAGDVLHEFILPKILFNFIGFEFLQIFSGPQIYVLFGILILTSINIAIGFRYRISIILFTIVWGIVYLMSKDHHNNHYYLIWLIAFLMCFMPANRWRSIDVKMGLVSPSLSIAYLYIFALKLQIAVVYFYAAVAKIYPDWLHAIPVKRWLTNNDYNAWLWNESFSGLLKSFLSQSWVHYFISYGGIAFDFLIIPAFLWKRTRTIALIASLIFHLSNSYLFHIGIFPFLSLSFVIFYYPPETIRSIFLKKRPLFKESIDYKSPNKLVVNIFCLFMIFQVLFPLHHHLIPGDVLWTDQGHRHTWRMMLRMKSSECKVFVINPKNNTYNRVVLEDYLMPCQIANLAYHPDLQWQFARILEKEYIKKWSVDDVQVSIYALVGVNGREKSLFTNKQYDITSWKWNYFKKPPWIMDKPF